MLNQIEIEYYRTIQKLYGTYLAARAMYHRGIPIDKTLEVLLTKRSRAASASKTWDM